MRAIRLFSAGLFVFAAVSGHAQTVAPGSIKLETLGISPGMTLAQAEAALDAAGYALPPKTCNHQQMDYHADAGLPVRPANRVYMLKGYTCILPMPGQKGPSIPDNILRLVFSPLEPVVIAVSREEKINPPVHPDTMQAELVKKWGKPTYSNNHLTSWVATNSKEQPAAVANLCSPRTVVEQNLNVIRSRSACHSAVAVQMFTAYNSPGVYGSMHMQIANFALANEHINKYAALQQAAARAQDDAARKSSAPKL